MMSMLVAAIAFALSLGALWFTSEVAKRSDIRGKILVKPHLASFNAALGRAEQQIRDLSLALEKAEKEIKDLRALRTADDSLRAAHRDPMEMIMKPAGAVPNSPQNEEDMRFRPTGTYS